MNTALRTLGFLAIVGLAACDATPTGPAARASIASLPAGTSNPQPAAAPIAVDFALTGDVTQEMRGVVSSPDCVVAGALTVSNVQPAVQEGTVLRVSQSWVFVAPGPCRSLGNLLLDGIVNTASGEVVLTGRTDDDLPVQVKGTLTQVNGATEIAGRVVVEDPNQ